MIEVRITKKIEDIRPNRSKVYEKGRVLRLTDPGLVKQYLETGCAELVNPPKKKAKQSK